MENPEEKQPQFGTWTSAATPPATYEPCIAAGRLSNENGTATHEAYWNGKQWLSLRVDSDGHRQLKIENVTAWMPMPPLPE